jgi:hypothetical protein
MPYSNIAVWDFPPWLTVHAQVDGEITQRNWTRSAQTSARDASMQVGNEAHQYITDTARCVGIAAQPTTTIAVKA